MPRDVTLGEGYVNGEMVDTIRPGQHTGQFAFSDGSSVLLREEPGMAAPPHHGGGHHHHGGNGRGRGFGPGWGQPYYEPLYIEVVDRDADTDDDSDLKGFADFNECVQKIVNVAARAAKEAVDGVKSGLFKSLDDVCAHIHREVCKEVISHHKTYCMAVNEAMKTAFESAKAVVEPILAGRGEKKPLSGAWCGTGTKSVKYERGVSGLEGPISSKADYDLLSKAQVRANAIMAEISGIGKDEWDAIKNEEFEAEGWSPADNYSYDNMMRFWLNNVKSIILTPSKKPTTEQINEVNRLAGGTDKLIALVKSHASPAAVRQGEADRNATVQGLSKGGYKSPEAVGWDTFQKEIENRASSLVSSGLGLTTIAAIAAGLLGAGYFLLKK
jgi:hypothetical protein